MSSLTRTITIERPIDDVFAVLTDVEQTGSWFPGDVEEQWTSPPPHGVGSTRHAIVRMAGRRTENDAVVTEYDPPNRAGMAGTTPNAPFVAVLAFERAGDGTRVDVRIDLALKGAQRIAGPIFLAWYGRTWGRGLATLKQRMESGEM